MVSLRAKARGVLLTRQLRRRKVQKMGASIGPGSWPGVSDQITWAESSAEGVNGWSGQTSDLDSGLQTLFSIQAATTRSCGQFEWILESSLDANIWKHIVCFQTHDLLHGSKDTMTKGRTVFSSTRERAVAMNIKVPPKLFSAYIRRQQLRRHAISIDSKADLGTHQEKQARTAAA